MRKMYLIGLLVAMVVLAGCSSVLATSTDIDTGPVFRTLRWGDPVGRLESSTDVTSSLDEEHGISVFLRRQENLSMGVLTARRILYFFFLDDLYRIQVWTTGDPSDQYDMASRMLEARYGAPTTRLLSNTKTWNQNGTRIQLIWSLFYGVYIEFVSEELEAEHKEWLEEYKDELAAASSTDW